MEHTPATKPAGAVIEAAVRCGGRRYPPLVGYEANGVLVESFLRARHAHARGCERGGRATLAFRAIDDDTRADVPKPLMGASNRRELRRRGAVR
jgi:hypothetical protein